MTQAAPIIIRPQRGPQEVFLTTSADIAIYGGAAGGGKTWAILLEGIRHTARVKGFDGTIFRRNAVQINNPGGLWDASARLYPLLGASAVRHKLEWKFPNGNRLKFAHLEHESTLDGWQGSEIPFIGFDELTHFSRYQFFYMLSRNRSMCGVRPYVRATCNPDADSWVAEFIAWWIDQDTGLPIPERSGVIRWMQRDGDKIMWADRPEDLPTLRTPEGIEVPPKSVTFIAAKLSDNKALLARDPGYYANLMAMDAVNRARLLDGNWRIKPSAGLLWRRSWCPVVDAAPAGTQWKRYWDLAATEKTDANDPDWTVSLKLGKQPNGRLIIGHMDDARVSPHRVLEMLKNTASGDGTGCHIGLPQDPGQAGKSQARYFVSELAGYTVSIRPERGDKVTRFSPFSAQCEAGNVDILRGPWNERLFDALEAFPDAVHDDHADACSGAFGMFIDNAASLLDFYRAAQQPGAQEAAA